MSGRKDSDILRLYQAPSDVRGLEVHTVVDSPTFIFDPLCAYEQLGWIHRWLPVGTTYIKDCGCEFTVQNVGWNAYPPSKAGVCLPGDMCDTHFGNAHR